MYDTNNHCTCDNLGQCEALLHCNSHVGKVFFLLSTEFQHGPKMVKKYLKKIRNINAR